MVGGDKLKIVKVLNNNLIYAKEKNGRYVVAMGRGIGFYGKAGQMADEQRIERVVPIDNQKGANSMPDQLRDIPSFIFELTNEILRYAAVKIKCELNKNVYLTLADHINFAVIRHKKGIQFSNPLLWEIKKYYPTEFVIGIFAIGCINEQCKTNLGDDEAAFIALQIVCARYDFNMPQIMDTTKLVSQIVKIIESYFDLVIEEDNYKFHRFITHLRFLAGRIVRDKQWIAMDNMDETFVSMVKESYKQEFNCALKIDLYIEKTFDHRLSEMELIYLTVHLRNMQISHMQEEKKCR